MKTQQEYRVTHFYGSFGTYNGWCHFHILPKVRSGSDQKGSKFESEKYFQSIPILSSFVSGFKKVICFDKRKLQMPKNAIQRSGVITCPWFLGHCTARNKNISLKFCTLVVGIQLYTTFSDFWISLKSILQVFIEKVQILIFGGKKPQNILEIRDSNFVERLTWHLQHYLLAFCFKTIHSKSH